MPMYVVGVNYKTAPLALREKLMFLTEDSAACLERLLALEAVREAVILSTCNRTEIICDTEDPSVLLPWMAIEKNVDIASIAPHWYSLCDEQAIAHIMRVTTGLDSMMLGEAQIFGQVKAAVAKAMNAGALGSQLERLFQRVFSVAKKIRTSTSIGACPMSLASTILKLVSQQHSIHAKTVLIVGAGDTATIIAKRFKSIGANVHIANRTFLKAKQLAKEIEGTAHTLENVSMIIPNVDIVVTATTSKTPLITLKSVAHVRSTLMIVDISVPRNVETDVTLQPHIFLYCIDDLRTLMDKNKQNKEHAAEKAEEMIQSEVKHFMRWQRSLEASSTINSYRQHVERISVLERNKAMKALANGVPAEEVITALSQTLANKLMHKPSVNIRKAGYDGRLDVLELAQELLGIKA